MMTTFKKITFLLLLATLNSCSDSFCERTIDLIENKCKDSGQCEINLADAYTEQWTDIYVFASLMWPEDITKEIGFDCECDIVPDDHRLILFIDQNTITKKIVSSCYELDFPLNDQGHYHIKRDDAVFNVEIRKFDKNTSYAIRKK